MMMLYAFGAMLYRQSSRQETLWLYEKANLTELFVTGLSHTYVNQMVRNILDVLQIKDGVCEITVLHS